MRLPVSLKKEIIEFLKSLPNMDDTKKRRAFIYSVGLDSQLQDQILFSEPPAQFVPLLVSNLTKYGKLNNGQYALEAVLQTAKDYIGQDRKAYCDKLIQELRIRATEQEESKIKRLYALVHSRQVGILGVIGIILLGTFLVVGGTLYITNSQTQHSEKKQLAALITQVISENNELITELHSQQQSLRQEKPEIEENFEPYFKIEALNNLSQNSLFPEYCQAEASQLMSLLHSLRNASYFAKLKTYSNTPEDHASIDTHRGNLEKSNELLTRCYTFLTP